MIGDGGARFHSVVHYAFRHIVRLRSDEPQASRAFLSTDFRALAEGDALQGAQRAGAMALQSSGRLAVPDCAPPRHRDTM